VSFRYIPVLAGVTLDHSGTIPVPVRCIAVYSQAPSMCLANAADCYNFFGHNETIWTFVAVILKISNGASQSVNKKE